MAWELILDNVYPGSDTYKGPAIEFHTEWNSILDLIWDTHEFVASLLVNITTQYNDVKPLQVKVSRQYETWYGIPYYHYDMRIYAHDSPIADAIVYAILAIIYIAVIAIAAWVILNSAKELIWGPGGQWPILPIAIAVLVIVYAYSKFKELKAKKY